MKFKLSNLMLIKVLNLMKGFIGDNKKYEILKQVHIVADIDKQKVCFECTNSYKAVKWNIDAEVEESGEGFMEITNYFLSLLSYYKDYVVLVYKENDITKVQICDNIIILSKFKDKYPDLSSRYKINAYKKKPLVDIHLLQTSLKAIESIGAKDVELNISVEQDNYIIKLVSTNVIGEIDNNSVEAIVLTKKSHRENE